MTEKVPIQRQNVVVARHLQRAEGREIERGRYGGKSRASHTWI